MANRKTRTIIDRWIDDNAPIVIVSQPDEQQEAPDEKVDR